MTSQQFNTIKGKRKYEGVIYDFTHFKHLSNGTSIVVYATTRTFNLLYSEVEDFLNSLEPVDKLINFEIMPPPKNKEKIFVVPKENEELRLVLLETLRSLKEKPTKEIIEQSNAVVNVTNAMINLQKTEIQIINIQKRMQN